MGFTKVFRCGDSIEVYEYGKNLSPRKTNGRKAPPNPLRRKYALRSEDSVRRARKSFRRLVRSNLDAASRPALLTLTMRQKLSYATSVRLFTQFAVRLRRRFRSVRYIAVPEFQQRGAAHWHVLIWGLPEELACSGMITRYGGRSHFVETCAPDKACERVQRTLQRLWLRGYADLIETDGHPALAGYLAKYMSKTMSDRRLRGKKAYYASRNIMRPMSISGNAITEFLNEIVPVDNLPLHIREFETQWLGRCVYKQYTIQPYEGDQSSNDAAQSRE